MNFNLFHVALYESLWGTISKYQKSTEIYKTLPH